ncbi:PepSY-associated TM helix domain-containing protein [Shewanella sp. FJAT-52076]|uniref:PepSY-associated TM helix domain-containing protein n=1 Tax=Shewanella sp. FJAT-52076 TaxID=2864202 RepID=UPI001C65621F|nr:PepSY-associated TM helix domain-containing protein [Shewanella sp. FJAT-52076]QYJ74577.1 PepSY-associated TM helix domain-containing protein [Shewanella sp. FJAT-52076]
MSVSLRPSKKALSIARTLHVYVSMALLLLMLFFAFTGITLNHPDWFGASNASSHTESLALPDFLLPIAADDQDWQEAAAHWMASQWQGQRQQIEVSVDELVLVQKGPGRYRTILLDTEMAEVQVESLDYGLVAVLNDLHKGRNSGGIWSLVIDASAILMLLFSLTGAFLLLPQSRRLKRSLGYMGGVTAACVAIYWLSIPG